MVEVNRNAKEKVDVETKIKPSAQKSIFLKKKNNSKKGLSEW